MDFLIKKQNYLQWHAASLTAEVIPYRPETIIHWYTGWKKSGVIEGSHHPRGKHTLLDTDPEFKKRAFDFCKKTVLANEKGLTEKVFFNFLQNQPEAAHFKRHGTHSTSRHYLLRLGFTPVYCYQTKSVSWCPAPWHKDSHHQIHVKHDKKEPAQSPPATSPAPSSSA